MAFDINAAAQALGTTPEELQKSMNDGGGGGGSTKDPNVTIGHRPATHDASEDYRYMNSRPADDPTEPDTHTASQVKKDFFGIPGPQLRQIQEKLYNAGYYGNLKKNQIRWGVHDPMTEKAYGDLVDHTAAYNESDPNKTLDDVLNEEAGASPQQPDTPPMDPADVAASAQAASQNVTGRRQADGSPVVTDIVNNAETSAGTYGSAPSQAWYEEQVRAKDPTQAQAYQGSQNVGTFLKMIDKNGMFSAY